jgi:acyl-CoA synthetase (NDP forming)
MRQPEPFPRYRNVEPLFRPRSITLVGASERLDSWPARIFNNLRRYKFPGKISLVNPRHKTLYGSPCFPSITEVPDEIDQLIIIVPAAYIPEVLERAGERGCRSAIIFSGGFAELNTQEGLNAQCAVVAAADRFGIAIGGPNCLGNVSTREHVLTLAEQRVELFEEGSLALVSQSSGLMSGVNQCAYSRDLGLSYAVASGGEANTDAADYLNFLVDDESTRIIGMILETIRRPNEFGAACQRASISGKPVIVLKIGRSEKGLDATLSHTGALSGSYEAFNAFCRRHNLITVKGFDELIDTAELILRTSVPRAHGVAAVASSGGARAFVCDLEEELTLGFPPLSIETRKRLDELLGIGAGVGNPLDIGAAAASQSDVYLRCLELIGSEPAVGLVAVQGELPHGPESAHRAGAYRTMAQRAAELGKSLVFFSRAPYFVTEYGSDFRKTCNAPFLHEIRNSFTAISNFMTYSRRQFENTDESNNAKFFNYHTKPTAITPQSCLSEAEAFALLRKAEINVARFEICDNLEAVQKAANQIGYPVVMKLSILGLTHKTEMAGVWLGLTSEEELATAFLTANRKLSELNEPGSVLIQEMVKGDIELCIGGRWDPEFGPIVIMSLGGIFVEAIGKSSTRLAPVNTAEAQEMIVESGIARALNRMPGKRECHNTIIKTVSRLSCLIAENRSITTLEINPLIVEKSGHCTAVDVVALVSRQD